MTGSHVAAYLTKVAPLALLIPLHELLHAGTCIAAGGAVLHLDPAAATVCGGTVQHLFLYDIANMANEAITMLLFAVRGSAVHVQHVILPVLRRLLLPSTAVRFS